MQDHIANALLVIGVLLVSLGAGIWDIAAGSIVMGAFCLFGGYVLAIGARK